MYAKFETEGVYEPDALVAGNARLLVARKELVVSTSGLARGALLGKVTTSGKYRLSEADAEDGSEVPDLILGEDVPASASGVSAIAYARGDFNSNVLTLGAGHSVDSVVEVLREKGITLLEAMA